MPRRTPLLALCALLLAAPAYAQAPKRTHDITIDDYFTQADLFALALAPDGSQVAYTEGRWQQSTDDRKTDLWIVSTKGGTPRKLTHDRASYRSPKWAPDSKSIYVLANRKREGEKRPPFDGKAQVWRVAPTGEPVAVTQVEGGVEQFDLSADGKALYYVVSTERIDGDFKNLRAQFRHLEYGHGIVRPSQVWRLDLETWRAEKVIDEGRVIREFTVAPAGDRVAMITTPDDKVVSFEGQSRVDIHDLKTGKTRTVPDKVFRKDAPSPWGWLEHLAWSTDGKRVAFNVIFDAYPAEIIVGDAECKESFKLRRPEGVHVKGYGSHLEWAYPDGLLFLGEEKGRVHLHLVGVRGDTSFRQGPLTSGDVVVEGFSRSRNTGQQAVILATPTHLPDVFLLGDLKDRPRRLTNVNPQADTWKLPQLSIFQWKAPDGTPVEGILELPPDYKPGQKVPLVVEIHGGPTTASQYKLQYWIYGRTLLPAKGYAVLAPNYRGSTGYGDRFLTDLVGRENDLDVKDILAGVDALVQKGIADPERLAVTGWSNGGYLTNCIITQTTRFKAAISGASIVDAVMEWGSNDEPAYTMVFKKGFPWDAAERYHKASPTYKLDKVRTPTLIHVGANDERCPPGHSRMLYRALKEYVNVPTELIVYPGEAHGLSKYRNRRAKLEWDLAWLERYVMGRN